MPLEVPNFGLDHTGWILFVIALGWGAMSGFFLMQEIGEVNRKMPDNEQISHWGMYPGKMQAIKVEYKRLYPSGRLEFWRFWLQVASLAFLGLAAVTELLPR
jgi:hypothetical protein